MQEKTKKEEYAHFNKLSEEWWDEDGKFSVLHEIRPIRINYILNQFNKKNLNKVNVLDIGCGGGLVSEALAKLGAKVTGIDFVEKNINAAKFHSKYKDLKIKYLCYDIEKNNVEGKYDLIIMFEILEHLDNWKNLLEKTKDNLNNGGKIIISTINRNIISKYTAIFLAENILKWIPLGTHDYNKFIKPTELESFSKEIDLEFNNLTGLIYNPIERQWRISNNILINYFCTLSKLN